MVTKKKYLVSLNKEEAESLREELEAKGLTLSTYFNSIVLEHFAGPTVSDAYLKGIGRKVMTIMSDEIKKEARRKVEK